LESGTRAVDNGIARVNEKDKPPGAHCVILKKSSEECAEPVFWGEAAGDILHFVFKCRSKEWLQAEGIMRKSRRPRSELEPTEDYREDVVPPRKRIKTEVDRGVKIEEEEAERVEIEERKPEMQTSKLGKKKRAKARG